jgi:hypothetical protein
MPGFSAATGTASGAQRSVATASKKDRGKSESTGIGDIRPLVVREGRQRKMHHQMTTDSYKARRIAAHPSGRDGDSREAFKGAGVTLITRRRNGAE